MMHAYDYEYLDLAERNLGDAFDFAIVTLRIEPLVFQNCIINSHIASEFSKGNPAFVAGKNGCELARLFLEDSGLGYSDTDDVMYLDKSEEYWAGFATAFAQWNLGITFSDLFNAASISDIIHMYPVYHEMDIQKFSDVILERLNKASTFSRLKKYRTLLGITQGELSERAGVPLRQIQLFEQGQRNINKTQAVNIMKLSRALHCEMEDLLEND